MCSNCLYNKTKYFRLRLSYQVTWESFNRANQTWDRPETDLREKDEELGDPDNLSPWRTDGHCDSLSSWRSQKSGFFLSSLPSCILCEMWDIGWDQFIFLSLFLQGISYNVINACQKYATKVSSLETRFFNQIISDPAIIAVTKHKIC